MDERDRRLGMDRTISRRDFLNGVSVAVGAALLPACSRSGAPATPRASGYYPPAQTGMRGSHAGSFEVAHATVEGQEWAAEETGEHYDLVVVGAGISGLAAAYIYRRDVDPNARILVLDNHDDFGGHAKRNEFSIDGETLLGFGGTMYIESWRSYPAAAKQVFRELGINAERYGEFLHKDLFESLGMQSRACFFDEESFGSDYLAVGSAGYSKAFEQAPLSATAKSQLRRLFADAEDYLAGLSPDERRAVLESHSWRDYLETHAGMGDEALAVMQQWSVGVWATGADALPAWLAWLEGYPGFAGMDLGWPETPAQESGGDFYYPDGNASVARMLVRTLIPQSAPGDTMEDIVTARFDYSRLDQAGNATRIRLNSTVVGLRHQNGDLGADVVVAYVNGSRGYSVTASKVVWAGYHAMLRHVCADVPADQAAAQANTVRAPLVYTNVLVRSWRSFADLGFWRAYCPGSFFHSVRVNRPVSIGGYRFPQSPDEPVVLHLQHIPTAPGQPAHLQFREGRRRLLTTSFDTFERNVRHQLGRMLGPGGFDPARDIAAITVNRWPHGYAYSFDPESGEVAWWPEYWRHERRPWETARRSIGNIVIAGTDSSSNAMTESAIEEAHRAVHESMTG